MKGAAHSALAAALTLAAAACGGDAGRASQPADQVAEAVERLEEALDERDTERICDDIFSPEARRRAGGEECARRLARTTRGVRAPRLEVVEIILGSDTATARVRASSESADPALDSIRLVRGEGEYRVEALSSG